LGTEPAEAEPAREKANTFRRAKRPVASSDYPPVAGQHGREGRGVLTVLIDSEGRVRDARLLQGSYDVFNEVALRKIRQAVFSPATNAAGRAVSCKVTLPIRFELQ